MGRIEGDIALENWLFGFRPCSGHGQFTLLANADRAKNGSQLSTAVSASFPLYKKQLEIWG